MLTIRNPNNVRFQTPKTRHFQGYSLQFFFIRTVCRHHRRKTHWLGGSLCCLAVHHYQSLSVRERNTQLNKRPAASANWDRNFKRGKLIVFATTIWKHAKWYTCFIICWTAHYYAYYGTLCQQFDCLVLGEKKLASILMALDPNLSHGGRDHEINNFDLPLIFYTGTICWIG